MFFALNCPGLSLLLLYNWDHFIIIFTLLIKLSPVSVVDDDVRLCVPDDAVVADAVGHQQQGQQQQADQVADNVVLIVVDSWQTKVDILETFFLGLVCSYLEANSDPAYSRDLSKY